MQKPKHRSTRKVTIECPNCKNKFRVKAASILGSVKSKIKSAAARVNGAKGGRPKKEAFND